jgi:hypothetical protein
MRSHYENVPGLGRVNVSNHAQQRMIDHNISEAEFQRALMEPIQPDVPDGHNIVRRWRNAVGLVILLHPEPDLGIKLITTIYRHSEPPQFQTAKVRSAGKYSSRRR